MNNHRVKIWLLLVIVVFVMVTVSFGPGSSVDASGLLQGTPIPPDCRAQGEGRMPGGSSLDIPFSCPDVQQVYFGVCEPNNEGFWQATYAIAFQGSVVASNAFESGEIVIQRVHVGWAEAQAGENVATLSNTLSSEVNNYVFQISPDWNEVAGAMQGCDAVITTVPPVTETVLFEQSFENVFDGQTLNLEGVIGESYTQVVFRARWPGSSGTLTVFPPSGGELAEGDAGVSHNTGPGLDEWIVDEPEPGQWGMEFKAESGFNGETVVLGAYVTGAAFQAGENEGSIRGTVFDDANRNGAWDQGEEGIPGVKVTVMSDGDWHETFTTGDDGTYAPVGLGRAYYSVEVEAPEGYVSTGAVRYDGLGIGITGRLALGIDFPMAQATAPSGLPATGSGPGEFIIWPVVGLLLVAGATLVWQLRRRELQD
jgi:hypothetical protein